MNNEEIEIAISIDCNKNVEKYLPYMATLLVSIFENTKERIQIHILHYGQLSALEKENLSKIVYRYNQKIKYHLLYIDKCFLTLKSVQQYSPAIVSKFYLTELVNVDKIIHFDSDIIVNKDIKCLWDIELGDNYVAGVNYKWEDTISALRMPYGALFSRNEILNNRLNAGVLIFNLKKIRKDFCMLKEAKWFCEKYREGAGVDEDFFMYLFKENHLQLDRKYNHIVNKLETSQEEQSSVEEAVCLHYIFHIKPLYCFLGDIYDKIFWGYFIKTPYYSESKIMELLNKIEADRNIIWNLLKKTKKEIMVFGTGAMAKMFLKKFAKNKESEKVLCFIDNDKEKWGKNINGINIYSPSQLTAVDKNDKIIVIAVANSLDIENMLKAKGFVKNETFFCIGDIFLFERTKNDSES